MSAQQHPQHAAPAAPDSNDLHDLMRRADSGDTAARETLVQGMADVLADIAGIDADAGE